MNYKLKNFFLTLTLTLTSNALLADNWITSLPDNVYVTQLSIPGTHDAGTGNGFSGLAALFGPATAQTQDVTIAKQWDTGIRAFDLRPCVSNEKLQIYHGIMPTKITFEEALQTIIGKLNESPGEFAVVLMRHEDDGDKGDASWAERMNTLLKSDAINPYLVDYTPSLTLQQVRGKILIISRDTYADTPMGAYATGWCHSDNIDEMKGGRLKGPKRSGALFVQDYYDMTESGAMDTKKKSITALLDCSTHINETHGPYVWIVNHTSGYTRSASSDGYRDNAVATNKCVIDYLATTDHPGPTGIILMDYAGVNKSGSYEVRGLELTEAIIANNSRYDMRGANLSGIDDITATNFTITGGIAQGRGTIYLYTPSGQLLATATDQLQIPEQGLYIVKNGESTIKVKR